MDDIFSFEDMETNNLVFLHKSFVPKNGYPDNGCNDLICFLAKFKAGSCFTNSLKVTQK